MNKTEAFLAGLAIIAICITVCFVVTQMVGCEQVVGDRVQMNSTKATLWYMENGYEKKYIGGWQGYQWVKKPEKN